MANIVVDQTADLYEELESLTATLQYLKVTNNFLVDRLETDRQRVAAMAQQVVPRVVEDRRRTSDEELEEPCSRRRRRCGDMRDAVLDDEFDGSEAPQYRSPPPGSLTAAVMQSQQSHAPQHGGVVVVEEDDLDDLDDEEEDESQVTYRSCSGCFINGLAEEEAEEADLLAAVAAAKVTDPTKVPIAKLRQVGAELSALARQGGKATTAEVEASLDKLAQLLAHAS